MYSGVFRKKEILWKTCETFSRNEFSLLELRKIISVKTDQKSRVSWMDYIQSKFLFFIVLTQRNKEKLLGFEMLFAKFLWNVSYLLSFKFSLLPEKEMNQERFRACMLSLFWANYHKFIVIKTCWVVVKNTILFEIFTV